MVRGSIPLGRARKIKGLQLIDSKPFLLPLSLPLFYFCAAIMSFNQTVTRIWGEAAQTENAGLRHKHPGSYFLHRCIVSRKSVV